MAKKKNPKTNRPSYQGVDGKPSRRVNSRALTGRNPRDMSYLKPRKFQAYLTLSELALFVPVDPTWLKRLEAEGRIPQAQRVKMGKLKVRLWSPEQAEEIKRIIDGHKMGRPKGS